MAAVEVLAGKRELGGFGVFLALYLSLFCTGHAQGLFFEDRFEGPGSTVDPAIWPGNAGTHVEGIEEFFGTNNGYLRLTGAGTKALSGDWSAQLGGSTSTFAFEYYEPSSSSNFLVTGYAATTSDINVAGAFVRLSLGAGTISLNGTEGTSVVNTGVTEYPRDTRLTFSLVLNDSGSPQGFNGGELPAGRLDVWYYNWQTKQLVYVMTASTEASIRSPVAVGFRTWSTETGVRAYFDNVKLLSGLVLVTEGYVPAEPPYVAPIPPRPFVHPSIYNTKEDLERIRWRVLHGSGSAAAVGWTQLLGSSFASLAYQHAPYSNVVVMGSGTTPSETQYRNDSQAARGLALRWVVSGDTRYRDKAKGIMNDWANTFTIMTPASGTSSAQVQLESAWAAPVWVAAADLVRYWDNGSAGWTAAEVERFDGMLDYLYVEAAKSATRNNNWGASAALAMMSVGLYQEDRGRFEAGVQTWRDRLVGINNAVDIYNDDSIYEVCRDTIHPQYTLTVWAQAAELGWTHGIDLYGMTMNGESGPQYAKNLEFFAQLFMGTRQHPCDASFTGDYVGQQSKANAYDLGHNHYLHRAGLTNMGTFADMVVNHGRPGGFDAHFPAWCTLTHGDLSAGIPVVVSLDVVEASSGTVLRTLTNGTCINLRELAGTNWAIGAQTTGSTYSVEFALNDTGFGAPDATVPYGTGGMPAPGNYFVSALPRAAVTGGTIPGDRFVRFVQVTDLPEFWRVRSIGNPVVPAWGSEHSGKITVGAAGKGIGGTADQFGLVSAGISGDAQITVRLVSVGAVAGTEAGVMFRGSTAAGSAQVSLLYSSADNGVWFRFRAVDSGASSNGTPVAVKLPAWLRLTRFGEVISGYVSTNGREWRLAGSAGIAVAGGVQAGLAVASGTAGGEARAEFEGVFVEPLSGTFEEWQTWALIRRGETNAASISEGGDPDGDERGNEVEFWSGSDPLSADEEAVLRVAGVSAGPAVRVWIRERKNAGELGRLFMSSPDLVLWTAVEPLLMTEVEDGGSVVVREVVFSAGAEKQFFRVDY